MTSLPSCLVHFPLQEILPMDAVLAFGFGYQEMIIVLFIALLLFGKKLPEVARNMGKGLTEFKKGMRGIEDEVHGAASYDPGPTAERPMADDELDNVTAPKFEPPVAVDDTEPPGDDQAESGNPDGVSEVDDSELNRSDSE